MDGRTFALISLFGVPLIMVVVLLLAFKLTPPAIWRTWPVQLAATTWFIGMIAVPVSIMRIDSQGDFFDSSEELVAQTFALPGEVEIDQQGDRSGRLGDCWSNAVNWHSEVIFPSAASFDRWHSGEEFRSAIVRQIAAYYGTRPQDISIGMGALDLAPRDPAYTLSDEHGSYQSNVRILEYRHPFVCAAIERASESGQAISLRRCDPIADPADTGSEGWVIVNPDPEKRIVDGRILFASGPSYCTNPVRRAVNRMLGLPHPRGSSDSSMGWRGIPRN